MNVLRLNQIMMKMAGEWSETNLLKFCTKEELNFLIKENYIVKVKKNIWNEAVYAKTAKGSQILRN